MKRIRYDGPGHMLVAAGREIPRGESDEVPDKVAAQLAASPHINVTVEPEATGAGQDTDKKE